MSLIDRRVLLRVRTFRDAERVQNVLLNTVSRLCSTSDRAELDEYTSLAMECLSLMPLVREHFKREATRIMNEGRPIFPLEHRGQCLQCGKACRMETVFCDAACEKAWDIAGPL
jgi:hypothetical protein